MTLHFKRLHIGSRWGAAAFVAGIAVAGACAFLCTSAGRAGAARQADISKLAPSISVPGTTTTPYPTNAQGQTYGSALGATSPSDQPDLILATGRTSVGPVTGYVLATNLDAATGANVATPQAALAWMQAHAGGPGTSIPLYTENGTTVVGTFTVLPPQPASAPVAGPGATATQVRSRR